MVWWLEFGASLTKALGLNPIGGDNGSHGCSIFLGSIPKRKEKNLFLDLKNQNFCNFDHDSATKITNQTIVFSCFNCKFF